MWFSRSDPTSRAGSLQGRVAAVCGALVLLAAFAGCTATSDGAGEVDPTSSVARNVGLAVENAYAETPAEIAQIAGDFGTVMRSRSTGSDPSGAYDLTELIVRLTASGVGVGNTTKMFVTCWRYEFRGRFEDRHNTVACPSSADDDIPTTVLPVLPVDAYETLSATLKGLNRVDRGDPEAVRAAVTAAFPAPAAPIVLVAKVGEVVGVTVSANRKCVLASIGTGIDVWYPQSDDATADGAPCSATSAAEGEFKVPPH